MAHALNRRRIGLRRFLCGVALIVIQLLTQSAHSYTPVQSPVQSPVRLAACLPQDGAAPIFVGTSGSLYVSTKYLHWKRQGNGGVSATVQGLVGDYQADSIYAIGSITPLFERKAGIWSAFPLLNRGKIVVSDGPHSIISVGRHLYQWQPQSGWKRIGSTRKAISVLWAYSPYRFFLADEDGELWLGGGSSWQKIAIPLAPEDRIVKLHGISGKLAVAVTQNNQVFSIGPRKGVLLPVQEELNGWEIQAIGVVEEDIFIAGQSPNPSTAVRQTVVAKVQPNGIHVVSTLPSLVQGDHVQLLCADRQKQLIVASNHGTISVRQADGQWVPGHIHAQPTLPSMSPGVSLGSRPARSGVKTRK